MQLYNKNLKILEIVDRDGGCAVAKGACVIKIHSINKKLISSYTKSLYSLIWQCLV